MDADGACDESTIRGQQNRVVLTPSRRCQVGEDESSATVATERGSPGRSRISCKPSRAGMLGNSGGLVVANSCVYLPFTREAAGALGARHSPRPLGRNDRQNSGEIAPRECGTVSLSVIARSNATKQSSFLHSRKESWIASRSLSSGARSRDPVARNDGSGCLKIIFAIKAAKRDSRHPEERALRARLEGRRRWHGACGRILRGSPKRLAPQDDDR
jgi:hypothetical protein